MFPAFISRIIQFIFWADSDTVLCFTDRKFSQVNINWQFTKLTSPRLYWMPSELPTFLLQIIPTLNSPSHLLCTSVLCSSLILPPPLPSLIFCSSVFSPIGFSSPIPHESFLSSVSPTHTSPQHVPHFSHAVPHWRGKAPSLSGLYASELILTLGYSPAHERWGSVPVQTSSTHPCCL